MKALIIAEHDNKQLKSVNFPLLSAGFQLKVELDLLIIGAECDSVVNDAQRLLPGLQKILVANASEYAHQLPENNAQLIADIASQYDYVLIAATTFGKNILPRVAALLDVAMISDVIQIISSDTFMRPIYAGNALATVQTKERIKVLSIRPTAFSTDSIHSNVSSNPASIEKITQIIPNHISQFIKQDLTVSSRPELTAARIVVAGGRGLKNPDNFKLIEKLADKLGAAVGASRAAVDAGFAPNDYQVGQTGKVVAPDLYIAIGISGAIQHLAGMKDSKVIVAINSDPDAPIFQLADYGLVGDLFESINELLEALDK